VPVVATNVGGIPEVISDGETGILTDKPEPRAFAEKILALAADAGLRARLGGAAKTRTASKFSREQLVSGLEEIYGQLKTIT
jgi:glycosyltransferase involved in cell wall biosynthesis